MMVVDPWVTPPMPNGHRTDMSSCRPASARRGTTRDDTRASRHSRHRVVTGCETQGLMFSRRFFAVSDEAALRAARLTMAHHVEVVMGPKPMSFTFERAYSNVYNLCLAKQGAHVARVRRLTANLLAYRHASSSPKGASLSILLLDDIALFFRKTYSAQKNLPSLQTLFEQAVERRKAWANDVFARVLPPMIVAWMERFYAPDGRWPRQQSSRWQRLALSIGPEYDREWGEGNNKRQKTNHPWCNPTSSPTSDSPSLPPMAPKSSMELATSSSCSSAI